MSLFYAYINDDGKRHVEPTRAGTQRHLMDDPLAWGYFPTMSAALNWPLPGLDGERHQSLIQTATFDVLDAIAENIDGAEEFYDANGKPREEYA